MYKKKCVRTVVQFGPSTHRCHHLPDSTVSSDPRDPLYTLSPSFLKRALQVVHDAQHRSVLILLFNNTRIIFTLIPSVSFFVPTETS